MSKCKKRKFNRRLNEDILHKKENLEYLEKETTHFFKTNWDAE